MPTHLASIVYLSHGGGPLPLLGDPTHEELVAVLRELPRRLIKPAAMVVVSAHWEAQGPAVTAGSAPPLIYDYGGFPPESYEIRYPVPGAPQLAQHLVQRLAGTGFAVVEEPSRGFDHGLFVPLKIMYPAADVPCVQLSLLPSLDPGEHLRIGEALADLRRDDILLIGSGFSFHNMRAFFSADAQSERENSTFDFWLTETLTDTALREPERRARLVNWADAPGARFCHPREEHLLPVHVCYGAANAPARQALHYRVLGRRASTFFW